MTETDNISSKDSSVPEGLPVFSDKGYVRNLQKLLTCQELEHSFNLAEYSPDYDQFVLAFA